MNTYGLNRHLNSFGLSYPGYWFVIIDDSTTPHSRIFIARGETNYIPGSIVNLWEVIDDGIDEYLVPVDIRDWKANENTAYIAYRIPEEEEARWQ